MAASLPVTMTTTRRCVPRHGFTMWYRMNFGNDKAVFNRDHWWHTEANMSHNDSVVDGLKLETRDDSGHVMRHVAHVENKHCGNKECSDDLFNQLGLP